MSLYKTYIFPIHPDDQEQARQISRCAGRIYSKTVSTVHKLHERKDIWLSESAMKKLIRLYAEDFLTHAQSEQAAVEQYYKALDSFFVKRKSDDTARPPYRTFKYQNVVYKESAITRMDDKVRFSNGRKGTPLYIKVEYFDGEIKYAEMIYNTYKESYQMHVVVDIESNIQVEDSDKVMSVDLGQIHPIVTFDGDNTRIYNGGKLNSFARFQNKELSRLQNKMSRCTKYSRRWRKLNRAKKKLLRKTADKIKDVLRKYTSTLIGYCVDENIGTIVIGDIKGIRENIDYGKKTNQSLHQWIFRRLTDMIEYKAEFVGVNVEYIDESYTSQTCPACGNRYKPSGRNYRCKECGFEYHRDGVGAVNIYKKYTVGSLERKSDWLEGVLASPVGVRYTPHLRCSADWNASPFRTGHSKVASAEKAAV